MALAVLVPIPLLSSTFLPAPQRLEVHPKVRRVYYPGLASHPDHDIAKQQVGRAGAALPAGPPRTSKHEW